jgi:hypothetical protein
MAAVARTSDFIDVSAASDGTGCFCVGAKSAIEPMTYTPTDGGAFILPSFKLRLLQGRSELQRHSHSPTVLQHIRRTMGERLAADR